jgi:hypothetical protein
MTRATRQAEDVAIDSVVDAICSKIDAAII